MKTKLGAAFFVIFGLALMPDLVLAGEWGVGSAVAHLEPTQTGVESKFIGVPYISYRSERLNIDLGTVSYALFRSRRILISMEGEPRFEGYDPKGSSILAGMEKRKSSFDAGIGMTLGGKRGGMKLLILTDITGAHEGYEARAQYQRPYVINRLFIAPAVGISWLDDSLVDYYYGVRSNEATSNRAHYAGSSTTNAFVNLAMGYVLSPRLELLGGLKFVRLGKNIENSPIVDKKYVTNIFTALQYKY